MNNFKIIFSFLGFSALFAVDAFSSPLTFEATNPGLFAGAAPSGISTLMNGVRKPENPASTSSYSGLSTASVIQQSVLSQISTKINNQIFNTANPSGTFDLGGGNGVSFVRTGGNIAITINDATKGVTVITIPDL